MDLTKEQFIAKVTRIVFPGMPDDATDRDRETVTWSAEVAWNTGCTVNDAVWYCRTFEEVNPELSEDSAFGQRDAIRAKYVGKARVTASPGNWCPRFV